MQTTIKSGVARALMLSAGVVLTLSFANSTARSADVKICDGDNSFVLSGIITKVGSTQERFQHILAKEWAPCFVHKINMASGIKVPKSCSVGRRFTATGELEGDFGVVLFAVKSIECF